MTGSEYGKTDPKQSCHQRFCRVTERVVSYGMGTPWNCRHSRNRLRLLDEIVRRLLAIDAGTTDGRYRLVERLSSFALAPYTARRDWLCGMDRYRRSRHRNSWDDGAGRFRGADEGALYRLHFGGRHRTQGDLWKLRIAR